MAGCIMITVAGRAQQGPTVLSVNRPMDTYSNHADQGRATYQNNSQFYNKDNVLSSAAPRGNGDYYQPGNSNPINHDIYSNNDNTGENIGTYDIYSGGILIRYNTYGAENVPGGIIR